MISFTLNGALTSLDLPDDVPLLAALRGAAGLSGPRLGCAAEGCGACMVLLDGKPVMSCTLALGAAVGREVTSVEGLGDFEAPHPLQIAFLKEQAGQCGYCLSGILVSAAALLAADPDPDDAAIRRALDPHLCRCGSHNRILRAVRRAAAVMRSDVVEAA
ncbi:(2Fe-2S)-binding protein [Roseomonas xinghualingensis]|uniref:(2Fe-2S)-binding protein n=1 Tax=Roseomonas xinghualingensis TaxID=2986475 RepID=UPI0021F243F0|nr:2Fe-2S iron-sulfur cluster-binding protein [Roseomonas sp. SXEYE001]MCV4209795.1 2Fe-2S iron-sulfur cluster-binding protein [Roseomonas sp. SXEYE001]